MGVWVHHRLPEYITVSLIRGKKIWQLETESQPDLNLSGLRAHNREERRACKRVNSLLKSKQ